MKMQRQFKRQWNKAWKARVEDIFDMIFQDSAADAKAFH